MSIRRYLGKTLLKSKFRNSTKKLALKFFSIFMVVNILFPASLLAYIPEKVQAEDPLIITVKFYLDRKNTLTSNYAAEFEEAKDTMVTFVDNVNDVLNDPYGLNIQLSFSENDMTLAADDQSQCDDEMWIYEQGKAPKPDGLADGDDFIFENGSHDLSICLNGSSNPYENYAQTIRGVNRGTSGKPDLFFLKLYYSELDDGFGDLIDIEGYDNIFNYSHRKAQSTLIHEFFHLFGPRDSYDVMDILQNPGGEPTSATNWPGSMPSYANVESGIPRPDLYDHPGDWGNSHPSMNSIYKALIENQIGFMIGGEGPATSIASGQSKLRHIENSKELLNRLTKSISVNIPNGGSGGTCNTFFGTGFAGLFTTFNAFGDVYAHNDYDDSQIFTLDAAQTDPALLNIPWPMLYLECTKRDDNSVSRYFINIMSVYKAYNDYLVNDRADAIGGLIEGETEVESISITPKFQCTTDAGWCTYSDLETNIGTDNAIFGFDLENQENLESFIMNMDEAIDNQPIKNNFSSFMMRSNGYDVLNDQDSKYGFLKTLYDESRSNPTFNSNTVNYSYIKNAINQVADLNSQTFSTFTGTTTLYLVTDKQPNTSGQQDLINAASTKGMNLSILYIGDGAIPASYDTLATETGGKTIDKGSQQEVSERFEDLFRKKILGYYTDFTYTVTSGTEGKAPLTVQFNAQAYNGYTPNSWTWDFNDDGVTDASGQSVSHTFADKGTFDIQLNTTDGTKSDKKINYDMIDTLSDTVEPFTQWGKKLNNVYDGDNYDDARFDNQGNLIAIAAIGGDINLGNGVTVTHSGAFWNDGLIVKYSPTGTPLWTKTISSEQSIGLNNIAVDSKGDVYVTGYMNGWYSGTPHINIDGQSFIREVTPNDTTNGHTHFVVKISSDGTFEWLHQLESDKDVFIEDIHIDQNDNLIMVGAYTNYLDISNGGLYIGPVYGSNTWYPSEIFVLKLSPSGGYVWGTSSGGDNWGGSPSRSVINSQGDVLVYGTHLSQTLTHTDQRTKIHLLEFDNSTGAETIIDTWHDELQSNQDYYKINIRGMGIDQHDNLYFSGGFWQTDNIGNGNLNLTTQGEYEQFLLKMDSSLNHEWVHQKVYDLTDYEDILVTERGEIILYGVMYEYDQGETAYVEFTNANGIKRIDGIGSESNFVASFNTSGAFKWVKSLLPSSPEYDSYRDDNTAWTDIRPFDIDHKNNLAIGGGFSHTIKNSDSSNFNMVNEAYDYNSNYMSGVLYKLGTGNDFEFDIEGWRSSDPTNSPISFGSAKVTNTSSGSSVFLQAPAEYLGDHEDLYEGLFSFDLSQTVDTNQKTTAADIIISGYGEKISYNLATNPTTTGTHYDVVMTESSGWVNYYTGVAVSQDTFKKILSRIQALEFRANYSTDANILSLHSVNAGVRNNPLIAKMTSNVVSGNYPLLVNFSDISTSSGLTTTRSWDFNNDGTVDSTVENPQYTYTATGTYTAMLTITDGADSSTTTRQIEVLDDPALTANFSGTPVTGTEPLVVNFTDSSIAENTSINSWAWDFDNNGTTDSTLQNPTYTYQDDGTYSVKLSISDGSLSDIETKTNYIVVNPANICTQNHPVTSDALVRAGNYANNNYGTLVEVTTKDGGTNYDRQGFLKFDLTGTDYTQVSSAKLKVYVSDIEVASSTQPIVKFYDITTNTWTENGITWNNKPTFGSEVATWNVVNTEESTWKEIDLTSYINSQLSGDKIINMGMWDTNAANEAVALSSKESVNVPFLEITGVSNNCPPVMLEGANEIDRQISTSYDDGGEDISDGNSMMRTLSDHALTEAWGSDTFVTGYRFNDIAIPQGATIKQAYLEFTAYETNGTTTSLTIIGDDTDNSAAFTSSSSNITSRADTTASAVWSSLGIWTLDSAYKSPDLKTIVQEIVDRGGWTSGNNMTFVISGTGERSAYSYDGSTTKAPKLHIEWD